MNFLKLTFGSGESTLDARHFAVTEAVSELFVVDVTARSKNPELDLSLIVGHPAALQLVSGYAHALEGERLWSGVCAAASQLKAEPNGLSTYTLRIVPSLWLLTQRIHHRIYQHLTYPDIVESLLNEWKLPHRWQIDRGSYPKLDFKVQYGETDYQFFSRLLEEAGIAFLFEEHPERGSSLVLGDALHRAEPRRAPPLPFMDNPNQAAEQEYVTKVTLGHEVRPGATTLADYDFRDPALKLVSSAPRAPGREAQYEQYRYHPAVMLAETAAIGNTPVADDQGAARHLPDRGERRATRELAAHRSGREHVRFQTNAVDLRPGTVFDMDHPHPELSPGEQLLITRLQLTGRHNGEWRLSGEALPAAKPYRPPLKTPKPKIRSVQSATVVGPAGEEIHTDEFGRVRIHFPWDRDGTVNERSSCWVRVNQGWSGTKYGMINLPRIGQEVLISFLDGNPDRPVVTGRVFNAANPVPYKLPDNKTISTQKSNSSIGSEGFNELKYEDKKGEELYYLQAEKNLRKFVYEDETITVERDRFKLVKNDERDTTERHRTEVTHKDRVESTEGNRIIAIHGDRRQHVGNNENERTDGSLGAFYRIDKDLVIHQNRRDLIQREHHCILLRDRYGAIEGNLSTIVHGDRHERVMGSQAVETGDDFHIRAGGRLIAQGVEDITIKTAGGFIRINSGGMTLRGDTIKINSGGAPNSGGGSAPDLADLAGHTPFSISPERVAELLSAADKHGVPLPDVLRALSIDGAASITLGAHGNVKRAVTSEAARAAAAAAGELLPDEAGPALSQLARQGEDEVDG